MHPSHVTAICNLLQLQNNNQGGKKEKNTLDASRSSKIMKSARKCLYTRRAAQPQHKPSLSPD
jgi:hypothetical protein